MGSKKVKFVTSRSQVPEYFNKLNDLKQIREAVPLLGQISKKGEGFAKLASKPERADPAAPSEEVGLGKRPRPPLLEGLTLPQSLPLKRFAKAKLVNAASLNKCQSSSRIKPDFNESGTKKSFGPP